MAPASASDAYSLIEQGKVDQHVASQSPKDRRAIFEEAAGISRFKAKKIEAQRRLARVDQNLLRLSDIVEEVESRLRSVKAQASKAVRYQEHSTRLKQLRTQLGWTDWNRFAERMSELETRRSSLEEETASLSGEIDALDAQQRESEVESERLNTELARWESRLADARAAIASRDATQAHLVEQLAEVGRQIRDLEQQDLRTRERERQLQDRAAAAREELEAAEAEHHDATRQRDEGEQQLAQAESEQRELQRETQELQERHRELQARSTQLEKELGVADAQHRDATSSLQQWQQKIDLLELDCQQHQSEWQQSKETEERLAREAEASDSALASARERLEAARQRLEAGQNALAELKSEHSGAVRRAEVLEELEQRYEGVHAGVRHLLEQSRESSSPRFAEVRGLVADLIQVQVEHAALIDVALGEVTQHVVIEGPQLIEDLVQGELQLPGRVGLIRLEEQHPRSPRDESELADRPGVIGRADQMVEAAPAYDGLIDRLLGNTWFVETLEVALQMRRCGPDVVSVCDHGRAPGRSRWDDGCRAALPSGRTRFTTQ